MLTKEQIKDVEQYIVDICAVLSMPRDKQFDVKVKHKVDKKDGSYYDVEIDIHSIAEIIASKKITLHEQFLVDYRVGGMLLEIVYQNVYDEVHHPFTFWDKVYALFLLWLDSKVKLFVNLFRKRK